MTYIINTKESLAIVQEIKSKLLNGERVKLTGLGFFSVKDIKARKGINPKTKEAITIPAHKRIKFNVTRNLKKAIQYIF